MSMDLESETLEKAFQKLEKLRKDKMLQISTTIEAFQYIADADEILNYIAEKLRLLSSLDHGSDDHSCEALLRRHVPLEREIATCDDEIARLKKTSENLCETIMKTDFPKIDSASMSVESLPSGVLQQDSQVYKINECQSRMECNISELHQRCEERKTALRNNCLFYQLKDGCEGIEKWMREMECIIDTSDFDSETEDTHSSLEIYLKDLVAHGVVVDELKTLCEKLEDGNSSKSKTARILFDNVYRRWQHLHDLTKYKEMNVKGYISLSLANRMCDETYIWLQEKADSASSESYEDIQSLDMLRRKEEAVGRELILAKERVKQVHVLVDNIIHSYPEQSKPIQKKVEEIDEQVVMYENLISEWKENMKASAGLKIFKTSANTLMDWSNAMCTKLGVREKVGDMGVLKSVSDEHKDLKHEIEYHDERFKEVEQLGQSIPANKVDVEFVLDQLKFAQNQINEFWYEKDTWLQQSMDLNEFNREADVLNSICTSQDTLLNTAEIGDTWSDVEILRRHHDTFIEKLKSQETRFIQFSHLSEALIAAEHSEKENIRLRCDETLLRRQQIKEKVENRKELLADAYQFQEFKADAQEMVSWILEKQKLASEFAKQDFSTKLPYKVKRQQTLEAEIAANRNRLNDLCARGQDILNRNSCVQLEIVSRLLKDLEDSWNQLIDLMEDNRDVLEGAIELRAFVQSVENILKKLEEINKSVSNAHIGNDLRSAHLQLKQFQELEDQHRKETEKIIHLKEKGDHLLETNPSLTNTIKNYVQEMKHSSEALNSPLLERKKKLESNLQFHEFKQNVNFELLWISEQKAALSTSTTCKSLLDAKKLQKKIQNHEASLQKHKSVVEELQQKMSCFLVGGDSLNEVTQLSMQMLEQWNQLFELFNKQKEKTRIAFKAHLFYSEANEIDAWIKEKRDILNNTENGKDIDAVIKCLGKHKALELEIDSYKGLIDELENQAESMIESNHPDEKIIKNRLEAINQDLRSIMTLCSEKRQNFLEAKNRFEFEKENQELQEWMTDQMTESTSEDYGEDYEHLLIIHQNFEFYRARIQGASKRMIQYEDFARRLINSNCLFADKVEESLNLLSSMWAELHENIEIRAFKMEAAAEIHRFHRDVTDFVLRIHEHNARLECATDINFQHENELLGLEAQVHFLSEESERLQVTYPGGNEEHIANQLAFVIENWNELLLRFSDRKSQLAMEKRIQKFFTMIKTEEDWVIQKCTDMETTPEQPTQELDLQILLAHLESRHAPLLKEGEDLLQYEDFKQQIQEKLKLLSTFEKKIKDSSEQSTLLAKLKKDIVLFLNEAKQIQTSFATKEVQFCGRETKETVEDIDSALKKITEFQKTMDIQQEKFSNWRQQGENLLGQKVQESSKIQNKIQELTARRKRLLDFCSERHRFLTELLEISTFKRDTIEAESWVQDKKNKLQMILRSYHQLSDEEKIKCLRKQQVFQVELEAHEPFITDLVKKSKTMKTEPEVETRVNFLEENWAEVKEAASRIQLDLVEARDMLHLHDLFDRAETWTKEKELMIQANDVGKDYEHCILLQTKLDDAHMDTKVDENVLIQIRDLAIKLSREDDYKGVYSRYERICERWEWLKSEIHLYRGKLKDALRVHTLVRDIDDILDRIREKTLILSNREDVTELSIVQVIQRKYGLVECDLTVLDNDIKKQENEAEFLSEQYQQSSGTIYNKTKEMKSEWATLKIQLKAKKEYIEAAHTSLKYCKDVDDFILMMNEILSEMQYGDIPTNSSDAQDLLRSHHELQQQINLRKREIDLLQMSGRKLTGVNVEKSIQALEHLRENLDEQWSERQDELLRCKDIQRFMEKVKQAETWLSSKEAYLANEDIGDSMSSVETLIRKHDNFENSCFSNYGIIEEVDMLAQNIKDTDSRVMTHWEEILKRLNVLKENCTRRKNILHESRGLQKLLLDMYEITNWINEKVRVAQSDNKGDFRNLVSRTQQHAAFKAEVMANHPRLQQFTEQAEDMIASDHMAASRIQLHVHNLNNLWEELLQHIQLREERLHQAYQILQFKHKLDDINFWIEETENSIEFEENMVDISFVQQEITKNQELQKESEEYSENLRKLNEIAGTIQYDLSKENIVSNLENTIHKFHSLENSLQKRSVTLQERFLLSGVENDINDELYWIEENIKICESDDGCTDILSVQAVQKKLLALESELESREPLISSVIDRGRRSNNDAAEVKVQHLEDRFQVLKDSISLKRLRLNDALEVQTYYFEATQVELWIKEKQTQVMNYDPERDIYSIQSVQKKLAAIEAATDGFRQSINELQEHSYTLFEKRQINTHNIRTKQAEINDLYEELRQSVLKKNAVLREKEDYFLFERDTKELLSQLKTMSNAFCTTEEEQDVEHVESMLQKLEMYKHKLLTQESSIQELQQRGSALVAESHSETQNVEELLKQLQSLWIKCNENAIEREKVLERGKLIHTFYKSINETVSWIHEKDIILLSEDYGHDFESIKSLLKHHDTLEGEMRAIAVQVQALKDESLDLISQLKEFETDITEKYQSVVESWKECEEKSIHRKEKLIQAERLQSYFDEVRDFHAWAYEMSALITSASLPQDVAACEALLAEHERHKAEIDSHSRTFKLLKSRGKEMINSDHFLANDIQTKIDSLDASFNHLLEMWDDRRNVFEQNLEVQLFMRKINELDAWLSTQEHNLYDEDGRSLDEVENLIQKHEQFEKKVKIYEEKFAELEKLTKFEQEVSRQIEEEEKARLEKEKVLEQQRIEEQKRIQEQKILNERQMKRTPTGASHFQDSDDDFLPPDSEDFIFQKINSRRYKIKQPNSSKTSTPVITGQRYNIPPTTAEGFLSRKQELKSGGKKSANRQWKNFYSVLCGQLLCFFKDKNSFLESKASKPPVNILGARCFVPNDYHKKKHVFRLEISDGSAFLFEAPNAIKKDEWIKKIGFTSLLPPEKQLMTASESNSVARVEQTTVPSNNTTTSENQNERPGSLQIQPNNNSVESTASTPTNIFSNEVNGQRDVVIPKHAAVYENVEFDSFEDSNDLFTPGELKHFDPVDIPNQEDNYTKNDNSRRFSDDMYQNSPFYTDPFEFARDQSHSLSSHGIDPDSLFDTSRSLSMASYDETLVSARSSLSNQSSYVTAVASTSSLSTLQDEKMRDVESDEEDLDPMRNTTQGNSSMDVRHEELRKHKSATIPTESKNTDTEWEKSHRRQRNRLRKFFSLNRHSRS